MGFMLDGAVVDGRYVTCGRGFMDKFSWTRFLILQEFRRLDFVDEVLWMVLVDYKFIIFIKR